MATTQRQFDTKQGDTGLTYTEQLKRNEEPVDLEEAHSIRFYLQEDSTDGDILAIGDAEIVDAEVGLVSYTLSEGDTARRGTHRAEYVVHWSDPEDPETEDHTETFPPRGWFSVGINPGLNRGLDPAQTGPGHFEVESLEATDEIITPRIRGPAGEVELQGLLGDLAGDLDAEGNSITDLAWPDDPNQAVIREYVDDLFSGEYVEGMPNPALEPLDMAGYPIDGLGEPGDDQSAVRVQDLDERALNTRRFHFRGGGEEEYARIAKLNDSTTNGRCIARLHFAGRREGSRPRKVVAQFHTDASGGSIEGVHHVEAHEDAHERGNFVVTKDPDTSEHWIYVRGNAFAAHTITIEYDNNEFSGFDFQEGLTAADLTGDIVYDTETDEASGEYKYGNVYDNGDRVATRSWTNDNTATTSDLDSKADRQGPTIGDQTPAEFISSKLLEAGDPGSALGDTPIISNDDQYIAVDPINGDDSNPGTDAEPLATIQEAIERCPLLLRHRYVIYLEPGVYDEDLEIRHVICTGRGKGGDGGNPPNDNRHDDTPPKNNLEIRGSPDLEDETTWRDYELGSLEVNGCLGSQSPTIMGCHFTRDSPYSEGQNSGPESDEWAAVSCHGGMGFQVRNCSFGPNVTTAIKAYGSTVEARQIEVDDGAFRAGFAKHHGRLQIRNVWGGGPNTDEGFYSTTSGTVLIDSDGGLEANSMYQTGQAGTLRHMTDRWVMFQEEDELRRVGGVGLDDGFNIEFFNALADIFDGNGDRFIRMISTDTNKRMSVEGKIRYMEYAGTPPTTANGDAWIDDGSTGNAPGLYYQVGGEIRHVPGTTTF